METSGNDDARKKRDSIEGSTQSKENSKKLRATKQRPSITDKIVCCDGIDSALTSNNIVFDLEVSLQQLVGLGKKADAKEFLSKSKWIEFRIGHAGDAAKLAVCYRKSKCDNTEELQPSDSKIDNSSTTQLEDTSLEVRLAESLGDEDTPPTMYALLAYVTDVMEGDQKLGAASLISSSWEGASKVMKVKMLYISDDEFFNDIADKLERRMWLRLSTLALMTSNYMSVGNNVTKNIKTTTQSALSR